MWSKAGVNLTVTTLQRRHILKLTLLDSWITEASARSYKVSKSASLDPFNFSQTAGTQHFLKESFKFTDGKSDLSRYAGRYPGSWTLPVCHASTWGKSWNWDYANKGYEKSPNTHPPCICGMLLPLCFFHRKTEIADWLGFLANL